jgi:hypothetical protein
MRRAKHVVPDVDACHAAILLLIVLSREKFRMEWPAAEEHVDETAGNVRTFITK